MSIFFKKFGPYSKLRTANWPIAWRKYNKLSYEAFLSAAMIIEYPNPLGFRLNNEVIISKEYLSMTKSLFCEVGFSEKRNKL